MAYDPVKAHEYYMKHRKLKGRRKKLVTQQGKEMDSYIKDQIKQEKKAEMDALREQLSQFIEQVRGWGKGMSKSQKESLKAYIAKARDAYKKDKEKITAKYNKKYEAERNKLK